MKFPLAVFFITVVTVLSFFGYYYFRDQKRVEYTAPQILKEKPLEKYTFENLSKTKFSAGQVLLGEVISDENDFTSRMFYFYVDGKKVSGLINIPKTGGVYPVVVMLRGYVEKEVYKTGIGTQRAGEVFAQNSFITLAPDFLGYGQSDNPSGNPVEERFQTYTTVLTLLESISNLNLAFSQQVLAVRADAEKAAIWGHSNGGQIALSILEISGKNYPTVLWAPVSKPFPYSILYYTDDFDDRGKLLRKVLAEFEKDYDVELYSLVNYFDKINAPIQLHQGESDEAVPVAWSNKLYDELKKLDGEIVYFKYYGADHNLLGGWQLAIDRSIDFYRKNLK